MVSLMDKNILDSLFLNIHFHGLDMKEGSVPAALINRIQTIKWDEATLPEKWVMDKATPSVPRLGPTIEQIKQDNSVYLEPNTTRNKKMTKSKFNLQHTLLSINLMMLSDEFSIDKETLRKDFYSPENEPKRRWFFQHFKGFKRQQIQDKFYKFVEKIKINIPFFDWFHAYTIKENINYPWKQDIIGDPTTNVFTNWQIKDGELIQLELPPTTQYQLPKVKDSSDKPVMATPFKTKDVNEEITPKDIRSLMEQAYYTNKYLQVIGETISKEKISTKPKDHECSTSNVPIEKPLFKPFKVNEKAKQKFRELRKSRSPTEECRTLADFRWYRDTFLTRVYTREDSQQSFWKEKFLAGLLRLLGDKIRDKIRSQSVNGDIPYDNLSYGQLISYVQKLALKICQDDKIQRQLAKEKAQTKRDLGSFCEKFGLPACPKQKKKQNPKKEFHENKNSNKRIFPNRKYSYKPSTNKDTNMPKTVMKPRTKVVCYNCGKQGHISKYCRLKRKLRNLNLDPFIEEQINNLLIETSEEESGEASSEENLNQIQQDDQPSSTDEQDIQEKTSENLTIVSSAIIENQGLRIETNFLLVKKLKNEVIIGTPFIRSLLSLHISKEGITTWYLGRKITFEFSTKPIARNINFIEKKISQINFLKDEVSSAIFKSN
ncbi:hypothetical protein JHK87_033867 [Glycine soja]|nr:hypothetical protein JHK87_033867 [Glycine soja]